MPDATKKLAKDISSVMGMWIDWYLMAPMAMDDKEFNKVMSKHYSKLKKEMEEIYNA